MIVKQENSESKENELEKFFLDQLDKKSLESHQKYKQIKSLKMRLQGEENSVKRLKKVINLNNIQAVNNPKEINKRFKILEKRSLDWKDRSKSKLRILLRIT